MAQVPKEADRSCHACRMTSKTFSHVGISRACFHRSQRRRRHIFANIFLYVFLHVHISGSVVSDLGPNNLHFHPDRIHSSFGIRIPHRDFPVSIHHSYSRPANLSTRPQSSRKEGGGFVSSSSPGEPGRTIDGKAGKRAFAAKDQTSTNLIHWQQRATHQRDQIPTCQPCRSLFLSLYTHNPYEVTSTGWNQQKGPLDEARPGLSFPPGPTTALSLPRELGKVEGEQLLSFFSPLSSHARHQPTRWGVEWVYIWPTRSGCCSTTSTRAQHMVRNVRHLPSYFVIQ